LPPNLAFLTRTLLTELHRTYLLQQQSPELEAAMSAYVEFWRSGGAERLQIAEVTRPLIERVLDDQISADPADAASFHAIALAALDHSLARNESGL
jgi:hypothetical protein